jgi:hypothetical protein
MFKIFYIDYNNVRGGTRVGTRVRATRLQRSRILLTFAPSSSISYVATR